MDLLFLADFSVIRPEPGLLFWTLLIFVLFWWLMSKFAFRPIQEGLKKREQDIQNSLDAAKMAREELANLQAHNEELLKQAQEERVMILREAKEAKETIIKEAKDRAKEEAKKIVLSAKQEIEHQKMEALTNIKNEIGQMAINIAEKVVHHKLQDSKESTNLVDQLVKEINFNN